MTLDITATDMFCGAGGTTTGATQAGVTVKLAINHWDRAIETHHANYPNTTHALTDLLKASPRRFPSTTILLASPECTAHSLAKGKKRSQQKYAGTLFDTGEPDLTAEAEERSRCTMWTPLDWAEHHNYEAVLLENVVDVHLWRPFEAWLQAWRSLDYEYEMVYLNSMFAHPTPQSRDRMYFVAWKRGNRRPNLTITPTAYCSTCEHNVDAIQCWKNPTKRYGKYKQQYVYCCPQCAHEVTPYYYAAANAIDWSIPAPRIGDRKKPLKEKTMRRIAYGLEKFAAHPFSVQVNKTRDRTRSLLRETFPNQTEDNGLAMGMPFLLNTHHDGSDSSYTIGLHHAYPTQTTQQEIALTVPPFMMDHLGEYRPRDIRGPLSTICASGNHQSLIVPQVRSWLMTYYRNGQLAPIEQAAPTVTTLARHALVTGTGKDTMEVEDCGFRMLVPKEIGAAMAFPPDYIMKGTRREQVTLYGNAVTSPVAKLLVERVVASLR